MWSLVTNIGLPEVGIEPLVIDGLVCNLLGRLGPAGARIARALGVVDVHPGYGVVVSWSSMSSCGFLNPLAACSPVASISKT